MDLREVKSLSIEGKEVKSLSIEGKVIWHKISGWNGQIKYDGYRIGTSGELYNDNNYYITTAIEIEDYTKVTISGHTTSGGYARMMVSMVDEVLPSEISYEVAPVLLTEGNNVSLRKDLHNWKYLFCNIKKSDYPNFKVELIK